MATLLAHIRVRPGEELRFEAVARGLYRASHDTDSGLRHYEYWRGAEPRTYYTLLSFDDFAGFLAHQTSDHHESAAPTLREVTEVIRLEWVDPVAGAAALPPTAMSPLRDDATPLERSHHERFAAQVQEWWQPLRAATGGGAAPGPPA